MEKRASILFIHAPDKHDLMPENIKRSGYDVQVPYLGNTLFLRIIREVWFRMRLPYELIWYNKRVNNGVEIIIVFDALMKKEYLLWLRENNPNSKIILFYTNPVKNTIDPTSISNECCEKWSCDKNDCDRYGMHWEEFGFYFKHLKINKQNPKYDVLYIGRDKGRAPLLFALKETFEKMNLKVNIHIVADRKYKRFSKPYYKKAMKYDKVRELVGKSRSIVNLVTGAQTGVTIRVYESIFNEIKLVTDNEELCKFDLYEKDNIFILGKDNISDFPAFLAKPYKKLAPEKIERYYFENWIERILDQVKSK